MAKDDGIAGRLEDLDKLFTWWGYQSPVNRPNVDVQLKSFQGFASELQKASTEAFSAEIDAIYSGRQKTINAMQALARSRRPEEFLAAEAGLLAGCLEEMSQQAKRWAALTERAHQCCAALMQDLTKDGADLARTPAAKPAQPQARESGRRAAE